MQYVYVVQWTERGATCAEVFATRTGAREWARHKQRNAYVLERAVRPDAFVAMCFGPADPAPATIAEMLASSNI